MPIHDQNTRSFAILVDNDDIGKRLDTFITSHFPDLSRSTATRLIRDGVIRVDDAIKKPGGRVNAGDTVTGTIIQTFPEAFAGEPVDIDIVFEDPFFLVINKKPGMVVHPAPGHAHGTLAHGLLFHRPQMEGIGPLPSRPGIVHRLDKDTSGIMIVAKTDRSYTYLVSQFKNRHIRKTYLGIVFGVPDRETGQIRMNIERHTGQRKKMSVTDREDARYAETHWKIKKKFHRLTLMEFDIKTGRTHQIRVHCAAIRHPIVGDMVYGPKKPFKLFEDSLPLKTIIREVPRQMLHAWRLELQHPETGETMLFEAPIPDDIRAVLENLNSFENSP